MGVLDKFLDIMKLDDGDDFEDDDFFDDDFDDFEEEKSSKKGGFLDRFKKADADDDFDDEPAPSSKSTSTNSKVTQMRQPAKKSVSMEVCVIKPTSVDDAREITDTLLSGRTVILNLEGLDLEIAQRLIDFTSGAAYAISGNLQKISNYIFLVTPTNVDISGDLTDLLGASFDTNSVGSRF